jgi:xeroderma pigmentosum group C-complementing protein
MPPVVPRKRHRSTSPESSSRKRHTPAKKDPAAVLRAIETLDSQHHKLSAKETEKLLALDEGEDSETESSDEEDVFEDVLPTHAADGAKSDEEDWEDAMAAEKSAEESEIQDLELTITHPDDFSLPTLTSGKKGPSKIEREIRMNTHRMHVLCLLRFNSNRNHWLNDPKLHEILLGHLSPGIKTEVERWKRLSGLAPIEDTKKSTKHQKTTKPKGKGAKKTEESRDWGPDASRLEPGVADLSSGDPTIRLLKYLAAFWKKRFKVLSPSLRKQGYKTAKERDTEQKAHRQDPTLAEFGERIESLDQFRELAKTCQGSRDVASQLFTGLLRALGLEARMTASLQPAGFGWSQVENASSSKDDKTQSGGDGLVANGLTSSKTSKSKSKPKSSAATPLVIDDSTSELSELESISTDSDIQMLSESSKNAQPDTQLPFPTYWTEVRGLTNNYFPVYIYGSPSVISNSESLQQFEPKGAPAEKAKQVICYTVSYYSDHAAKDVTVRYLRKHIFPGKTKGFRLPPEKIPIYNRHGKVISHVEVDWFQRVMKMYARPAKSRHAADDLEDKTDLVPQKIVKAIKENDDGIPDTIQGFKNSLVYVLSRHLRREEAILPSAKPIKQFSTGKGPKAKTEPVYLRKDVATCKTVENWHREGREIRQGEQPLKHVPIRAVTWARKMEVEQTARETGEKPLQGLYSRAQTDWLIPPPIQDGIIPKNVYGNIDIYVRSMIPRGAAHVPLRGTVRVCKKLGIDYAEACVGFEFGNQMAVPVIEGVVVAEENVEILIDAWNVEEERKRKREEEKKAKEANDAKRKKVVGKQIKERLDAEYGDHTDMQAQEEQNAAVAVPIRAAPEEHHEEFHDEHDHEAFGGGFLLKEEQPSTPKDKSNEGQQPISKVAPRSLRSHLHSEEHQPLNSNEEDNDEEEDDMDDGSDDDSEQEEYADFARRKKRQQPVSVKTGTRRSSRNAAQKSPYFK